MLLLAGGFPRGKQSARAALPCAPLVVCLNYWGIPPAPFPRQSAHFLPPSPKNYNDYAVFLFPFWDNLPLPRHRLFTPGDPPLRCPAPFAFLVACGIVCGTTPVLPACGPRTEAPKSLSKLFQEDLFEMKEILLTLVTAVAAYLLGCISTGTIVSRREGVNIRNEGSHNTGASNVLRVLGLKDGLITFLGDFAKAALACLIGNLLVPSAFGIEGLGRIVAALFVVIGHNWPVFYHFQGGKGVACSTAVVLLIHPLCGLPSILLCVLVIAVTKYISLGSMTMLLTYMVLIWIVCFGQWALCIFATLLFIMCVYRHRANIQRLLNGTENKIGRRVQPQNTEKK